MSLEGGAGSGDKDRNADADDNQEGEREVGVLDEQPPVIQGEAVTTDLNELLENVIAVAKIYIESEQMSDAFGMSTEKGLVLSGKPDLGLRVQKFLEEKGKNIVNIWPRNVETLTARQCEDTFERAVWFSPSIVLLIGLEHAAIDVAQVIQNRIKENADTCAHVLFLATTTMFGLVPENLKGCFSVVNIQEPLNSTNGN